MKILQFGIISLLLISLGLAGCSNQSTPIQSPNDRINIVTTIYPLYEFTRQVGGDKVQVDMLISPGVEPHDWEPSAQDLIRIKSSKLFVYHGAGLEAVDKLLAKEVLGGVKSVEVSKGLISHTAEKDEHQHQNDVHTWLDPILAKHELKVITKALCEVDPANKEYYERNADRFAKELDQLDNDYKTVLANVKRRDIITSHAAFGYLANRYNLKQTGIMGLSPDSEPTPERMAQVVKFCRENQVKYIFFETLLGQKLAETIANETGAGLLVLNPLENLTEQEFKEGKNYIIIMRENLVNLEKALNN
ncbi:MAG: zinc ABC transporter substrate-binding protein [Veillonellaceae bacterium]|jgi:zinc transport system substrate-binding protein|nr:zinc ABC transporter substrate-binding protein [Veillonellaceae bacterium]